MLAASLNAFFCASPIYGSAEDFRLSQNFTVSREVTPAAEQQIGETRKKCNSDDRRQWRKQGGAVGAAASRMRAAAKQTLGAATRLSAATSFFPFRQPLRDYQGRAALDSCLPRLESSGCFSGSLLARKRELSPNAKALCPPRHRRASLPHGAAYRAYSPIFSKPSRV
uniref:Uncharacterized protein n=1 Tax=Faecalibacterium prausnitzii TaxID=853 RepID=A0A564SHK4_9FIRM|nr:Uncharacterised protein [Faecalibacterium prausnitzii]